MAVNKRWNGLRAKEAAAELLSKVMEEKPLLPFLIPIVLFAWAVESWLVPFSNWVPLAAAVWATIQHGRFERQILVEDLNTKWKQLILNTSLVTPREPCAWLNKLLTEVWPNFMEPKLSQRFFSIVERRLKDRKPKLIEKLELQKLSLGSSPPTLGSRGAHWITLGEQRVMRLAFDWDTNEIHVMLLAKLAKPLLGTTRIVVNNIYIKGDLLLIPILDSQAILYSFESTPEIRCGVAFGTGSSQPATELPGVSPWLVKVLTETITKLMVEPRRQCYSLPSVNMGKRAVGGVLSVNVISASLRRNNITGETSYTCQNSTRSSQISGKYVNKPFQTFIEVEVGDLTRRTHVNEGANPIWDSTFNIILHGDTGVLKFHLYDWDPTSVKLNYLASCEIKMKYVLDDSTTFWAIGYESGVIAKQSEYCGKEVQMVVPFEEINLGELTVSLVLKEWQFSDGSVSLNKTGNDKPVYMPSFQPRTGRKLKVTVLEGRNLRTKEKSGKCDLHVKLQYGKALYRTTTTQQSDPVWDQKFEFDEIADGEYLKINCYNADTFGDENIGSARVNLEGIVEGFNKNFWVPLEKASSGELSLRIEAVKNDDHEGCKNSGAGWLELVIIEAKDLVVADIRGTSDPYVRVHYGNTKKRTKVIHKTLTPQWNQTLEFTDTGSPLTLHVKDHNDVLPTKSIGHCTVEYERLPPNLTANKWIPLQGVKKGEIHVKITRKVSQLQNQATISAPSRAHKISSQVREILKRSEGLVADGDLDGLSLALSEMEGAEDAHEEYLLQLEREKSLLIDKINELGRQISRTASGPV